MNDEVSKVINQYHLGSVILFRENLIDTPQTVELLINFNLPAVTFHYLLAPTKKGVMSPAYA